MLVTLLIFVAAIVFFVIGKVRSDLVALSALILLMLFNILTPAEAVSGFANPITMMIMGLFVVSGAIIQTGLAKILGSKMLKSAGNSPTKLFIIMMLVASSIGAFVSNTGTVALMMPIVVSMAMAAHLSPSRFLMPLAFAGGMGGMMTLIGTPPNLIINETLINGGFQGLSLFSFLPVGLICVTVGTLALIPLSKIFLSKDKTKEQTANLTMEQALTEVPKVTLNHKAPIAALIMLLMIAAMVLSLLPVVTAVMLAAVLMVLTGCIRNVEEAYKTINWQTVVLIGAMLPMSLALEKTGVSAIVSDGLVNGLGSYGPLALLGGIYFGTSLTTIFISNTATTVLFAPIALYAAVTIGVSPYPFLFAVTIAASMCFASPFSTPPNALVMSAGRYTFQDYLKVGLPLQLLFGIVMVLVLPLLFPF